ncbi:MAG: hypothetical protein ACK5MQ_10655 [Pikeienuella sp.]
MNALSRLTALALAMLCATPLLAAEFDGHLALGVNAGNADFDRNDTQALARLEYRLTHEATLGPAGLDFVLGGEAWTYEHALNDAHLLREAYVEISGDAGRIGFGRQVRIQGVADGFIPTDVVAPRNFRLTRYETEGNRFGLNGAWGTLFLSDNLSAEAYAYAGRRSHVMPHGLYTGGLSLPDRPVASNDPVYGGRLSYLAEIGDFGLSFYQGAAAYPVLAPSGHATTAVVPQLRMIGLDADTVFGPWRVYGEAALHLYSAGEFGIADGFLPDDEIQSTVGVERELEGGSRLGFQLFHRMLQNRRSRQAGPAAPLAAAARGVYGQFRDRQTGVSLSYTWTSDDTRWSAEAAASSWFQGDGYLSLRVKYRSSDNSAIYLSGSWLDGPRNTLYGEYSKSSNLNLEFRLFF